MRRGHIKLILFFALPISALVLILALYAPNYLNYADPPIKANAVVLFIGSDLEAREKEANKLLDAGYADYLIIPAYGRISMKMPQLPLSLTLGGGGRGGGDLNNDSSKTKNSGPVGNYPRFYENTHIEALEAKRMLDDLGLRSAMLISSAYHMRRIRLIAVRVFDAGRYSISCKPASWGTLFTAADWLNQERRQIIVSEYVKMAWFLVYAPFATAP
jgi:uncharacterized SAM-binding protein YcdF (DUF218 family)